MKKLVIDYEKEGLISLIGERITLMCAVYFYTGKLIGVNDTCVKLEDPAIVYETGGFDNKDWADAQKLPNKYWYVQLAMIESWGIMK
jgi:hypothetical protein